MFTRTKLCSGLMLAFGGTLTLGVPSAVAQQQLERVEITGSAIRRIQTEGALPVTVITRKDIERSGATSTAELIQRLPSMQGFTTTSESVNGGGGGTTTASLHSLGSEYTLVLLNGRRIAPFNTGSTVNLENLPLSAIERVEVLTDGASALYGSDAIGGVVNFILRRNLADGNIEVSADKSEAGGGETRSFSITKGFGDLSKDGFNLMFSLSGEEQKVLKASNRSFASSGIIKGIDGKNLGLRLFSSNTVPGTVVLQKADNPATTADESDFAFYTPYLSANGKCPPLHVVAGLTCRFDFAGQVDIVPKSSRTTLLLSGRLDLTKDHQLFGEAFVSRFANEPGFAPPAQPGLYLTQALFDKHVTPYLPALGFANGYFEPVGGDPSYAPSMNVRVFDAGNRRNRYTYNAQHLVFGSEGAVAGWDYQASYTNSVNKFTDKMIGGYLSKVRFDQAIDSGAYDPLGMTAGQATGALASAVLNENDSTAKSVINVVNVRGSRPLFKVGSGDAALALGAELMRQSYSDSPTPIAMGANSLQPNFADTIVGGGGGALPFDASRKSYGAFAELLLPLTKQIEVTGALRFDSIDAVENSKSFDSLGKFIGSSTQGSKNSAATYKLSARYQPAPGLLFRGSIGTGFKAPTLNNVSEPLQAFGVTSASYDCPFVSGDPLFSACRTPDSQYNQLSGGNPSTGNAALKPEKSRQFTLGLRFEPSASVSVGLDFWQVDLKNQIIQISEQVAFADPQSYRNLFAISPDPVTGQPQLTFILQPINSAKANYRGIDLDTVFRAKTEFGSISSTLAGTYMLKADYEVPGLPGLQSSLGKFGVDNQVVFRWVMRAGVTLEAGGWTHGLTANYKRGYQDHQARCTVPLAGTACPGNQWVGPEIRTINPTTGSFGGRVELTRSVAEYMTFDWQTKYAVTKAFEVTAGVRNILDEAPPFSVQDAGGGNMRGYDGRYADPIGRTYYLKANYKF